MNKIEFENIISTFNEDQLKALRVVIATERRLRSHFQPNFEKGKGALEAAQDYALESIK